MKGDLESCTSFVVSVDSLDVLRFLDALVLKYQCEPIGANANFPISTPSIPCKSARLRDYTPQGGLLLVFGCYCTGYANHLNRRLRRLTTLITDIATSAMNGLL